VIKMTWKPGLKMNVSFSNEKIRLAEGRGVGEVSEPKKKTGGEWGNECQICFQLHTTEDRKKEDFKKDRNFEGVQPPKRGRNCLQWERRQ